MRAWRAASRAEFGRDTPTDPCPPRCREHWRQCFGVFDTSIPPRMVARATLGRAGNVIDFVTFMGHAEHQRHGVMKLLMFDIVRWALESGDPLVGGVQYLHYGSIEASTEGLTHWRRRLGFAPFATPLEPVREKYWKPADFDPLAYLRLNPDLRAAGMGALAHYREYGAFENRQYRDQQTQASTDPVNATLNMSTPAAN